MRKYLYGLTQKIMSVRTINRRTLERRCVCVRHRRVERVLLFTVLKKVPEYTRPGGTGTEDDERLLG